MVDPGIELQFELREMARAEATQPDLDAPPESDGAAATSRAPSPAVASKDRRFRAGRSEGVRGGTTGGMPGSTSRETSTSGVGGWLGMRVSGESGPTGEAIQIPLPGDLAPLFGGEAPPPAPSESGAFDFSGVGEDDIGRGPRHVLVNDGDGGYRMNRETFVARVDRDGRVTFRDKANVQSDGPTAGGFGAIGWAGRFDLTDAVMRAHGEDPYRYEKAKFLDETREMRDAMAVLEHKENLRESVLALSKLLDEIWRHTAWSREVRRRVIFELWDDCAEEGEADVLAASQKARATIDGFVRRRLAADSVDGYSSDELDRLNRARRSAARFDPYASGPATHDVP